jgi:hypothetical protein
MYSYYFYYYYYYDIIFIITVFIILWTYFSVQIKYVVLIVKWKNTIENRNAWNNDTFINATDYLFLHGKHDVSSIF